MTDYGSVVIRTTSRRPQTPDVDLLNDEPALAETRVVNAMHLEIKAAALAIIERYNAQNPMLVTTVNFEDPKDEEEEKFGWTPYDQRPKTEATA
jgi:hypothetical protein